MPWDKPFYTEIVRPNGVVFGAESHIVVFPASDGERAVLYQHAPFLCQLGMGLLRILDTGKKWHCFWIKRGIAEVTEKKQMWILPEEIKPASEINIEETKRLVEEILQRPVASSSRSQREEELHCAKSLLHAAQKASPYM